MYIYTNIHLKGEEKRIFTVKEKYFTIVIFKKTVFFYLISKNMRICYLISNSSNLIWIWIIIPFSWMVSNEQSEEWKLWQRPNPKWTTKFNMKPFNFSGSYQINKWENILLVSNFLLNTWVHVSSEGSSFFNYFN